MNFEGKNILCAFFITECLKSSYFPSSTDIIPSSSCKEVSSLIEINDIQAHTVPDRKHPASEGLSPNIQVHIAN